MQPAIVAMVLAAAVAHAVWNLASKYKRGDTLLFVWAYTCVSALWCVPAGIALMAEKPLAPDWHLAVGAAVSAALHVAYSIALQAGYDRAEIGVVYPVARGTAPVLTMSCAVLVLGERLSMAAALGALLIVGGILVVTGNPFGSGSHGPLRGALWGTATGATIASYTLWDSYSVTTWRLPPVTYYASTLLLQLTLLTPAALRRRDDLSAALRANAVPIVIVAVFSPLAYMLVLTAMQSAPVALVAPLRESSIVVGALLGYWLFRENHLARRVAGAAVVLAGIVAISSCR